MPHPSAFTLLRSHFDAATSGMWFAVGAAVGLCAWRWGTSPVSAWGLKLATGFGAMLVLPLLATILLSITARTASGSAGALAYGDFRYILPWLLSKVLRAAATFWGVVAVAAVCWCITGSSNAQTVMLSGAFVAGVFTYCWAGTVIIAGDLKRIRRLH